MQPRPRKTFIAVLRAVACLAAIGLLVRALVQADLSKAAAIISRAGPAAFLIVFPYLLAITIDTAAWQRLFAILSRRVSFRSLLAVRLSAEAVSLSLPAGAVFAESLNPLLLDARCGVPLSEAVVGMASKKWLVMRAHAMYIVASVVIGYAVLRDHSVALVGIEGLPWIVLASSLVPLALSLGLSATFICGSMAARLHGLLRRFPVKRVAAFFQAREQGFSATDESFARFSREAKGRVSRATLLFFAAWLVESVETLLILRVLGADIGFAEVIAFEAGLSLLRCMAFFSPAGLGVQDLGYMAFFTALGLPDAAALGAAFVILKRAKEVFWIAVGYVLFLSVRRRGIAEVGGAEASRARQQGAS